MNFHNAVYPKVDGKQPFCVTTKIVEIERHDGTHYILLSFYYHPLYTLYYIAAFHTEVRCKTILQFHHCDVLQRKDDRPVAVAALRGKIFKFVIVLHPSVSFSGFRTWEGVNQLMGSNYFSPAWYNAHFYNKLCG